MKLLIFPFSQKNPTPPIVTPVFPTILNNHNLMHRSETMESSSTSLLLHIVFQPSSNSYWHCLQNTSTPWGPGKQSGRQLRGHTLVPETREHHGAASWRGTGGTCDGKLQKRSCPGGSGDHGGEQKPEQKRKDQALWGLQLTFWFVGTCELLLGACSEIA